MAWKCSRCKKITFPWNLLPSGLCCECDKKDSQEKSHQKKIASTPIQTETPNQSERIPSKVVRVDAPSCPILVSEPVSETASPFIAHEDWIPIEIEVTTTRMKRIVEYANEHHSDLVEMSTASYCCGECAKYQGRIYSLVGRDPRFPKLPESFLPDGKVHEDCQHYLVSVHPNIPTCYVRGDTIAISNRPFIDDRPQEVKDRYYREHEAVTVDVLAQIPNFPFALPTKLRYDVNPPCFVISDGNMNVVQTQVDEINQIVADYSKKDIRIPANLGISKKDVHHAAVFCTPFTPKMKISKNWGYLTFSPNLGKDVFDIKEDSTNCNENICYIYYQTVGHPIKNVRLNFWRKHINYVFNIKSDGDHLVLESVLKKSGNSSVALYETDPT